MFIYLKVWRDLFLLVVWVWALVLSVLRSLWSPVMWSVVAFGCWFFGRLKNANSHQNRNVRGRDPCNCRHFWMLGFSDMPTVTWNTSSGWRSSQLPSLALFDLDCVLGSAGIKYVARVTKIAGWLRDPLVTVVVFCGFLIQQHYSHTLKKVSPHLKKNSSESETRALALFAVATTMQAAVTCSCRKGLLKRTVLLIPWIAGLILAQLSYPL